MQEKSNNNTPHNFHLPRFMQVSESHCGPATVQMLLDYAGVEVTQEAIADSGGAKDLIELNGMRVDQLSLAVEILAPHLQFWYKQYATLQDLIVLVSEYSLPVGVEWQGLFEDGSEQESETGEEDYGHYSVVTHVNLETKHLIIADPYKDYISKDRVFTFQEFDSRWWDFNEIPDPSTGGIQILKDDHMMFVITPRNLAFPEQLAMVPGRPHYSNLNQKNDLKG
jgi:hypothetical protein